MRRIEHVEPDYVFTIRSKYNPVPPTLPTILPSTFDLLSRTPGSFKYIPTTGGKARRWIRRGKRRVMVIHGGEVERDTFGGALHFYEVDKKGRFLGCWTLADIYGTEKSLRDEI